MPDGARMLRAGGALEKLVALWRDAGPVLTEAEQAMSLLLWKTHLEETEHDLRAQLPKRHLVTHLVCDTKRHGNPRYYAVWLDEALNKLLKKACRGVSQQTFDIVVLLRFREYLAKSRYLSH